MLIKREDWKTEIMPNETASFDINKEISKTEYARMILGYKPKQMEDKWFAFVENDKLFFHRSWSGFCIYETEICKIEKGYLLSRTLVNRKVEEYKETNIEKDKELLHFLIDVILLGKNVSLAILKPVEIKKSDELKSKSRFESLFRIFKK